MRNGGFWDADLEKRYKAVKEKETFPLKVIFGANF